MTFDPAWLDLCPTGLLLAQGKRVLRVNDALSRLTGVPRSAWLERPPHELIQRLSATSGPFETNGHWLHSSCHPLDGGRVLCFVQDRTREHDLERHLREASPTDPLTGLANRRGLAQALNGQVTRSRRYGNPLSIAVIEIGDQAADLPVPDPIVLAVGRFLRERLRWADTLGRLEQNRFLAILAETSEEAARRLLAEIATETRAIELPKPFTDSAPELRFGVAQWHKGQDANALLTTATEDLSVDL